MADSLEDAEDLLMSQANKESYFSSIDTLLSGLSTV